MNGPMKDWDAMGSDWRGQAVPTIDIDALRAEAAQQGRRLRRMLVLETLFAALTVISIVAWRAYARTRPLISDDPTLNRRAEQIIGRIVTLNDPIVDGRGRITLDGVTWTVEGEDMEPGCGIRVIGVDSTILKVVRT